MSINIMNLLWWREDLSMTEKFVALALADAADDDDAACHPAVITVAVKCCCSERTVQNAIKALVKKQLLKVYQRTDRSSYYIFRLENMPYIKPPRRTKERSFVADHAPQLTGESPSDDLFCTGAGNSVTGESLSVTGESPAPRTSLSTSLGTSETHGAIAPLGVENDHIIDQVAARWNEAAERHPGIQKARLPLDDARRNGIRNRSKRVEEGQTVEQLWDQFFQAIEDSEFLQGRAAPGAGRSDPFKLSMTWALGSAKFNEIMEGKYGNRHGSGHSHTADGSRRLGPAEQAGGRALARFLPAGER